MVVFKFMLTDGNLLYPVIYRLRHYATRLKVVGLIHD
jgi:hypothetical protein